MLFSFLLFFSWFNSIVFFSQIIFFLHERCKIISEWHRTFFIIDHVNLMIYSLTYPNSPLKQQCIIISFHIYSNSWICVTILTKICNFTVYNIASYIILRIELNAHARWFFLNCGFINFRRQPFSLIEKKRVWWMD